MSVAAPRSRLRTLAGSLRRLLPPVRLLLVALTILASVSVLQLQGLGVASLLGLPLIAAGTDLVFQRIRFRRLRAPEAALATGLILALLLPPSVELGLAAVATVAAVGLRHALRWWGHPIFNPAATGALLGAVLFGLAPAWWAAVSPSASALMIVLGALLVVRSPARWRIPAVFFGAYAGFTAIYHVLIGGPLSPHVLFLAMFDPAVLFFGLFMVTEPRTSSSNPRHQPWYALAVAGGTILLAIPFPSVGVLLALLLGNALAAAQRDLAHVAGAPAGSGERAGATATARAPPRPSASARWSVPRRVGALISIGVLVLAAAARSSTTSTPSALITPHVPGSGSGASGGGSGVGVAGRCTSDNPAIPASTLQSLHQALGPSTILSYDPNNGVVVFYDPVNGVTVTETDMYEDYGFAEFNGDDYAVPGCAPSTA